MPWFKLDDSFHSHPKVIAAGNEATGLYVRCGSYAAQHLTDGFIPEHVVLLYGTADLAETLVDAKLWRRAKGGWRMPDYLQYNPSRAAVENNRADAAERQRRSRAARLSQRDSQRDKPVTHSTPTRPDPLTSSVVTDTERGRREPSRKPGYQPNRDNGAATRQPVAFGDAIEAALNPDGGQRGRHARPGGHHD